MTALHLCTSVLSKDCHSYNLFQTGSECNSSTLTFDGVDLMGERLAEEVKFSLLVVFCCSIFSDTSFTGFPRSSL